MLHVVVVCGIRLVPLLVDFVVLFFCALRCSIIFLLVLLLIFVYSQLVGPPTPKWLTDCMADCACLTCCFFGDLRGNCWVVGGGGRLGRHCTLHIRNLTHYSYHFFHSFSFSLSLCLKHTHIYMLHLIHTFLLFRWSLSVLISALVFCVYMCSLHFCVRWWASIVCVCVVLRLLLNTVRSRKTQTQNEDTTVLRMMV